MVEATLEKLAPLLNDRVRIAKINVDQNPATASKYNITGVPTFIVFKTGNILARRIGAQSKEQLLDMLRELNLYNG